MSEVLQKRVEIIKSIIASAAYDYEILQTFCFDASLFEERKKAQVINRFCLI